MMAARKDGNASNIRYDEPMSRHTSWRVGGPADIFFTPTSVDELATFLRGLDKDIEIFWHGVGSSYWGGRAHAGGTSSDGAEESCGSRRQLDRDQGLRVWQALAPSAARPRKKIR